MKFALIVSGLAISAGAFAGTWSVFESGVNVFGTPTDPGFAYSGSVSYSKTAEFSMDINRSANTSSPLGALSGSSGAATLFQTTVRYTASPGEFVDTSATHTLTWARARKLHLTATASGTGNSCNIKLIPETYKAAANSAIPWDEDGTLVSGVPVYQSESDVTVNFTLYHVSGSLYEGTASINYPVYEFAWEFRWVPSIDSIYVLGVNGSYRRKHTATHVDGVALP